jgi:hypothetical protein
MAQKNLLINFKNDTNFCTAAPRGGNFECLKFLRESGFEWDKGTCENAAKYGHLDCLKYHGKREEERKRGREEERERRRERRADENLTNKNIRT